MSELQELLDERYPPSEISDIQRREFEEGWNEALEEVKTQAESKWLLKTMSICESLQTNNNGKY
jgi:hypothetical protein